MICVICIYALMSGLCKFLCDVAHHLLVWVATVKKINIIITFCVSDIRQDRLTPCLDVQPSCVESYRWWDLSIGRWRLTRRKPCDMCTPEPYAEHTSTHRPTLYYRSLRPGITPHANHASRPHPFSVAVRPHLYLIPATFIHPVPSPFLQL